MNVTSKTNLKLLKSQGDATLVWQCHLLERISFRTTKTLLENIQVCD
jgi:hypothetical protein